MEHTVEYIALVEREGPPRADLFTELVNLSCLVDEDYFPAQSEARGFKPFVRQTLTTEPREVETFVGSTHALLAGRDDADVNDMGLTNFRIEGAQYVTYGSLSAPPWIEDGTECQVIVEIAARSQHRHHFERPGLTLDYSGAVETEERTTRFSRPVETAFPDGDGIIVVFDPDLESAHNADIEITARRNLVRVAGDGSIDWIAPDPGEDEEPYGPLVRIGDSLYTDDGNREIDPSDGALL